MRYPAQFTPAEEGGYVVTFRDLPEAITQGDDDQEAMAMAEDVLLFAMEHYFDNELQPPMPSDPQEGERLVALPPSAAAKVLLLNEMLKQKVRPVELADRMGTSRQVVNRIVNLHHATKIDQLGDALKALGKHLEIVAV